MKHGEKIYQNDSQFQKNSKIHVFLNQIKTFQQKINQWLIEFRVEEQLKASVPKWVNSNYIYMELTDLGSKASNL